MAIDTVEAPASTPSPTSSHFSNQPRHFYLAVDSLRFKMKTLLDLLRVAGQRPGLPVVVCCSSRDELDSVCSHVSSLPFISLSSMYSDMAEADRALVLERFRQSSIQWNQNSTAQSRDTSENSEQVEEKSHMIVVTDTCLPIPASGESPISARLLINYELPAKKETYMRRISTCLAADGIVINMVVGGEVVFLKGLEESIGILIAEMPINISEIL
ncbi:ATP-dependent RNA helicase eIF4A isoform X1 [Punica granatum]|uniref:Uncharacterized protein n=2 Tax=Punica granatum TaxID=22663 RepID=A0A218W154_PUNGR|nr:ATP-dependent RNA helicase eIF4A isoform X1 [Punica granatum]OWM66249.1 hypothetical protein CDL15_Pgr013466 [Punica granatum]PKI50137.1 hypothetical protein CRG98_029461 [Punica granatum]